MADNYKVGVEVTADSKEAEKGLKDVEKSVDNLDKTTKKANKSSDDLNQKLKNLGQGFQTFGKNMSLYVTGPLAALAAVSVRNFGIQEAAINQLNQSLKNAGTFSREASEDMQAFASQLQQASVNGDETTLSMLALARNFTQTNEQAKELVSAAADLSAATGKSFESSVVNLGKTFAGLAGEIGQSVPALRDLTAEQLKAGEAIDLVAKKFAGSALAETKTFNGQVTQLKNSFGDLLEIVGQQLVPFISSFVTRLQTLIDYLNQLDPVARNLAIAFAGVAAAIGPLSLGLGTIIKILPTLKAGFTAIVALLSGPLGIALAIGAVVAGVAGLVNVFLDLRKAGLSVGESLVKIFKVVGSTVLNVVLQPILKAYEGVFWVVEKVNSFLGFEGIERSAAAAKTKIQSWSDTVKGLFTDSVDDINQDLSRVGTTLGSSITFGLADKFKEAAEKVDEEFTSPVIEQINSIEKKTVPKTNALANTLSNSFANAFTSVTDGTKKVGEAFSDMAQSIVQDLTRMIIQQAAYNAIAGLLPGGAATGAATGGYVNDGQITHRYAKGGMVRGPGTGTSDSIPARLSNGEFVSDAKTVSYFGADFFLNLKHMARSFQSPSPILNRTPGFANGGLVGGTGVGETRVVIQNSGSPKEATSVTTEQDAQGTVLNIILEDISKNGRVSRTMQSTYGLKRGGL